MRIISFQCRHYLIFLLAFIVSGCTVTIKKPIETTQHLRVEVTATKSTKAGYDVLGLAKYCDTYLKAPKLPVVSTVLNVFGDPLPCIEKRINLGGLEIAQVDLRDATCFRNKVCPPGTPALQDWKVMLDRARQVNKYAAKYPAIEWQASPYLEHDFKDASVIQKACTVIMTGCPTCKCVNSPFSGTKVTGFPLELHGTKTTAWSVSGDGASSFDADNIKNDGNNFQHRVSGDYETLSWWNELNGRCTGEHTFTAPKLRTAWPELWQFSMAHKLMTSIEDAIPNAPKVCRSVRGFQSREINKPTAERYCNGEADDGRGNKPLLIINKGGKRGDRLKVFDPSGKEVGCFSYYGTYSEKPLHRWYMGNCSKKNPWELYRLLRQEWGFVSLGGGACLRFNSIRRQNIYR